MLPDPALGYLADILFDAGPTMPTGLGEAPLSHGELRAYQENMGIRLNPFEIRAIRAASASFLVERSLAEDPARPAPWDGHTVSDAEKAAVARSLRDSIRRMAK